MLFRSANVFSRKNLWRHFGGGVFLCCQTQFVSLIILLLGCTDWCFESGGGWKTSPMDRREKLVWLCFPRTGYFVFNRRSTWVWMVKEDREDVWLKIRVKIFSVRIFQVEVYIVDGLLSTSYVLKF